MFYIYLELEPRKSRSHKNLTDGQTFKIIEYYDCVTKNLATWRQIGQKLPYLLIKDTEEVVFCMQVAQINQINMQVPKPLKNSFGSLSYNKFSFQKP